MTNAKMSRTDWTQCWCNFMFNMSGGLGSTEAETTKLGPTVQVRFKGSCCQVGIECTSVLKYLVLFFISLVCCNVRRLCAR